MKTALTILGISLLSFPLSAHGQSSAAASVSADAGLEARSGSAGSTTAGAAALESTAQARLPEAHVRRTIAQGEARGASASQIERAAMQAHTRVVAAGELLRQRSPESNPHYAAEVTAAADAMAAGASRSDLTRVRDAAPEGRSLESSFHALARLRASGAAGGDAARQIAGQLRSGASDNQILDFASQGGAGRLGAGAEAAGGVDAAGQLGRDVGGLGGSLRGAAGVAGGLGGVF